MRPFSLPVAETYSVEPVTFPARIAVRWIDFFD